MTLMSKALWACTFNVCTALPCCFPTRRANSFPLSQVHAAAVYKASCKHQCKWTEDHVCVFTLAVNSFDCSLGVQGLVQVHKEHPSIRLLPDQCLEAATPGLPARHIFMKDCMPVLMTDRPFHPHALFRIWVAVYGLHTCLGHPIGPGCGVFNEHEHDFLGSQK